ncbi:MAG: hypothetical protein CMP47_02390 [Rickettsiales bacterium]|nr:hypothetical protein [Rickettsiales bacterium]
MAFHLLKSSIVEGVKDFYTDGFDGSKALISDNYEKDVLSKSRHKFEASLLFLVETESITEKDAQEIQKLREFRNQLAHDIPSSIYQEESLIDSNKIEKAGYYLNKIDNFWGQVEVDINPDFKSQEVDYNGIKSLRSMVFDHISEVVRENNNS